MISFSDVTPSSAKSMSMPFSNKPISITPQRLIAMMLAVAVTVFLATSYCYESLDRNPKPEMIPTAAAVPAVVPVEAPVVTTKRMGVTSVSPVMPISNKSLPLHDTKAVAVVPSEPATVVQQQSSGGLFSLGPVASEVGIIVAIQAVFPLVSKAVLLAKQVKWASLGVKLSPSVARFLKTFGKVWHTLMMGYKKTSASKIVSRAKKMIKIYKYHDEHDDDDEHHHHDEHGHHAHSKGGRRGHAHAHHA